MQQKRARKSKKEQKRAKRAKKSKNLTNDRWHDESRGVDVFLYLFVLLGSFSVEAGHSERFVQQIGHGGE